MLDGPPLSKHPNDDTHSVLKSIDFPKAHARDELQLLTDTRAEPPKDPAWWRRLRIAVDYDVGPPHLCVSTAWHSFARVKKVPLELVTANLNLWNETPIIEHLDRWPSITDCEFVRPRIDANVQRPPIERVGPVLWGESQLESSWDAKFVVMAHAADDNSGERDGVHVKPPLRLVQSLGF
jgi:hypothetical protein